MPEIVHDALPQLANPRRFVREAGADLRRSLRAGYGLFRSGLTARHRRSLLGYLWLLLPAIATVGLATFVQSRRLVAVAPTSFPYPVFVATGMVLWQLFVEALNAPIRMLSAGRQIATRSRVPHEALILAGLFEVILNGAIRLAVLAAALLWLGIVPGSGLLLFPAGLLTLALLGLGIGLLVAPLGLLYDDVGRAIPLVTTFWFFLTPILYPAPADGLLRLNPVTPLLETSRSWLTGGGAAPGFAAASGFAFAALILPWFLYRIARPHIVARLG